MGYAYRDMESVDLERVREIDRSEHVTTAYAMDGGRLVSRIVDWDAPAWHDGTGDSSFGHYIDFCADHRRHGIARELVERLTAWAQAAGAVEIHVSATPSESAVSFYRSLGFVVTDHPNAALLALEPEDIHLRRSL